MCSEIDHTSVDVKALETSLRRELETIQPSSNEYCIYRVPKRLRQSNETENTSQIVSLLGPFHDGKKAMEEMKIWHQQNVCQSKGNDYTPQVVSIGPFHHGKEELKSMEMLKKRYLQNFLDRTTVSLGDFLNVIRENEETIRNSYAEIIEFDSEELVKMILVDGVFIIEVFLRDHLFDTSNAGDRLYDKPWLIIDVKHDIFLLENQLPFFILKDLFEMADLPLCPKENEKHSLVKLTYEFCKCHWDFFGVVDENLKEMKYSEALHLVDFLRTFIIPYGLQEEKRPITLATPNVTELHHAGVKFKPRASSKSLFDIRFHKGVLEIPVIRIGPPMEILLKNLLAFEQCHCYDSLISDYVILMSNLIDTAKDVHLLDKNGIIDHRLRSNEAVSTLFHNFIQGFHLDLDEFYFTSLAEKLNSYCKNPLHKWKANLKEHCFRAPWVTASVIAGVILLVLTFVKTVCSILQVHNP